MLVLLEKLKTNIPTASYEIIFIDDGSTDNTLNVLKDLKNKMPRLEWISFSRNFGHQYALRAGLAKATGDAVISMDGDLQHPPEIIPQLIQNWQVGYDIVYTIPYIDSTNHNTYTF